MGEETKLNYEKVRERVEEVIHPKSIIFRLQMREGGQYLMLEQTKSVQSDRSVATSNSPGINLSSVSEEQVRDKLNRTLKERKQCSIKYYSWSMKEQLNSQQPTLSLSNYRAHQQHNHVSTFALHQSLRSRD